MAEADFDVAVIGGGVVGLAAAASLAKRSGSVVLFERHDEFGRETSSRNSEVVHAGIYYEAGSLKARLCVEGRRMLYELCDEDGVPHNKCGKVIVAVSGAEEAELERLRSVGAANGVEGLRMLDAAGVRELEPRVAAVAGLLSPESGIVSAHDLMDALARRAEARGADLLRGAEVLGLSSSLGAWEIGYRDSEEEGAVTARAVVNSAGLGATNVMAMAGLDAGAMGLAVHLCKGEYFAVGGAKRREIGRLVYPVPRENLLSLGVHTVLGLDGGFKLGPSAFYVDEIDYGVDEANLPAFYEDVKPYLPFLEPEDLTPDMSGIRPKLSGPGESARDFHIAHEPEAPGFFNLVGIDSPGLTAAPAIGEHVAGLVAAYLG